MSKKKAEFKIAKTFGEILNDSNSLYAVWIRSKESSKIKQCLVKGYVNRYGQALLNKFNVYGGIVVRPWYGEQVCYILNSRAHNTDEVKQKSSIEYYGNVFFTSKEEAYENTMHKLRLKKLELNKQIAQLQNELYAVE